jgi:O-antigen ligase
MTTATAQTFGRPHVEPVAEALAPPPVVRWALCAYVFSLLFEAVGIGLPVEMTQVTGAALVGTALLTPRVSLRFPPAAFWCFAVYTYVGYASNVMQGAGGDGEVIQRLFVALQLLLVFWIASNLMRDERTAREALLALTASCLFLAALGLLGLTTTTAETVSRTGRLAAFGLDPNHLACILGLGILVLLGFAYGVPRSFLRVRLLVWPLSALIGLALLQTGSRGGLVALGAGVLALAIRPGSFPVRARNLMLVAVVLVALSTVALNSPTMRARFEKTLAEGTLSHREVIYPTAWRMFTERPVLGWGPLVLTRELGNRLRLPGYSRMDPHNLVLYVLTATGIVGAIPFFVGTILCARGAWRARYGPHGAVPLALLVTLLLSDMSVSGLHWKQHWLVMAYALASGSLRLAEAVSDDAAAVARKLHPASA